MSSPGGWSIPRAKVSTRGHGTLKSRWPRALARLISGPVPRCADCHLELSQDGFDLLYNRLGNIYGHQWWRCIRCGYRLKTVYSDFFWLDY
jgi:hypothetical protein